MTFVVSELASDDVGLVALVDRSEHVDVEYEVVDGELTERPVTMADVPPWDAVGDGPHSVTAHVAFCRDCVANGAQLLGAFDGDGELLHEVDVVRLVGVQGRMDGVGQAATLAEVEAHGRPGRRR